MFSRKQSILAKKHWKELNNEGDRTVCSITNNLRIV